MFLSLFRVLELVWSLVLELGLLFVQERFFCLLVGSISKHSFDFGFWILILDFDFDHYRLRPK